MVAPSTRSHETAAKGTMRCPVTAFRTTRRPRLVLRQIEVVRAGAIDRAGERAA